MKLLILLSALLSFPAVGAYRIAVIDSGYTEDIKYFPQTVKLCKNGHYDFTTKTKTVGFDSIGHGTLVADTIDKTAGPINRSKRCYMIYKVGLSINNDLANAVIKATKRGVKVINISVESSQYRHRLEKALKVATSKGVKVFVAAGNSGTNLNEFCMVYPACFKMKNLYTVGALNLGYEPTRYSNYGSIVTIWELDYAQGQIGTSFASPRAAGKYMREIGR